jgi:hypothetical protein
MLYERLAKIPIDGRRIFVSKDIDHYLASVGAQGVGVRERVLDWFAGHVNPFGLCVQHGPMSLRRRPGKP